MRKWKRGILGVTMAAVLCISLPGYAADLQTGGPDNTKISTVTVKEDYGTFSNVVKNPVKPYGTVSNSFLTPKEGQAGFQAVIADGSVRITDYDTDWKKQKEQILEYELPIFGGFYAGEKHYYIVYGQSGKTSSEAYRIVKYDKAFRRIASLSVAPDDSYTSVPFDAGNVSIAESGNQLIVYTSRLRMDGHQSNIAIRVNTDTMQLSDEYGIIPIPDIHVSHSFRQIVRFDGNSPVYADVSDAAPERSVYLQAASGKRISMLDISGQDGDNVTNTDLSDLAVSDTGYMAVGTQVHNGVPNIYLSYTSKDKNDQSIDGKWLTAFTSYNYGDAGYARIREVSDDLFAVMWNETRYSEKIVRCVMVDGRGEIVSGLKTLENAQLTLCEPVLTDGRLIWTEYQNGMMKVHVLSDFACEGKYEVKVDYADSDTYWDGSADTSWYVSGQDSFEISTAEELAGLAQLVNEGNPFEGKSVYLTQDIFLNPALQKKEEWMPIAYTSKESLAFEGTFHGQGHTVYNMLATQNGPGGALFGRIGENGVVKAVNVSQGYIEQDGSIASENHGIIAFCSNSSLVGTSKTSYVGGIVGINSNIVYGCSNTGDVWGNGSTGGIVGRNKEQLSTVDSCWNTGMVSGIGFCVGGIVGDNYGWIYDSCQLGTLKDGYGINAAKSVSGICGGLYKNQIRNCYFAGTMVIEDAWYMNGTICGDSNGTDKGIENCYSVPSEYNEKETNVLPLESMKSAGFVKNLDTVNAVKKWSADTMGQSAGLPVPAARIDAAKGLYKLIPDLWVGRTAIDKKLGDESFEIGITSYGDGKITYHTDSAIVSVSEDGLVTLKKPGTAVIVAVSEETENFKRVEVELTVTVTGDSTKADIAGYNTKLLKDEYTYNGDPKTPAVEVEGLAKDKDYKVEYRDNVNAGTAKAVITGIGNYTGTVILEYTIKKAIPAYDVPQNLQAVQGNTLSDVALPEGFQWMDGSLSVGEEGEQIFYAVYTPADTANCEIVRDIPVKVTVFKKGETLPFQDVRMGDWFYPAVRFVYEKNIMTGLDASTFGPAQNVSRGQFATILHRMEQSPAVSYKDRFMDVLPEQFYTIPVLWASADDVKVVNGYQNGNFGPADDITREQMAVMMYRYADYKGYDTKGRADLTAFPDEEKVSAFSREAMEWAVAVGLISGNKDGTLAPQGEASRAVCATIMMRFLENLNKD